PRSVDRPGPARARADPRVHCPGPLVSGRGPEALEVTRRQLLKAAAAAAFAQVSSDPATVATLEAFADTLLPGEKRSPTDRAIAGAAPGAGAVQAGALDLMGFPAGGAGPALLALACGL